MLPTAYQAEWEYLQAKTDLWRRRGTEDSEETARLKDEMPPGQVLIACLGPEHCQREFRAITCRAFPFFPYFNSAGEFLGLSYYWEYEDRCWVINNLDAVTPEYRRQFIRTYDALLARMGDERPTFQHTSAVMREVFVRRGMMIPLLHRDGDEYEVSPDSERLRPISPEELPKFGPYEIAAQMPFPDEAT
jgi:hypothetical protein